MEPIVSTGALWVVARDGPSGGGGGGLVNQPRTRVSGPVARPLRLASDRVIHSS